MFTTSDKKLNDYQKCHKKIKKNEWKRDFAVTKIGSSERVDFINKYFCVEMKTQENYLSFPSKPT